MSSSTEAVSGRRLAAGYVVLVACAVTVIVLVLRAGADRSPPPDLAGRYQEQTSTGCLGTRFLIEQSGVFLSVEGPGGSGGSAEIRSGRITGTITCADGGRAVVRLAPSYGSLRGSVAGAAFEARRVEEIAEPGAAAVESRPPEETFGRLMLAVAVVILAARLLGAVASRLGQPRVMGEVVAGILLGPSLLGAIAPDAQAYLFPSDIVPLLTAGASIGLVFYMFLVGLEVDPAMLRGRVEQAAFISHASIAVPMALGVAAALPLFSLLGPSISFLPFALFIGVAMSITAFPVLARILVERRMLGHPVGAMAIASAAVDDVTAWILLALASGMAVTGGLTLDLVRILLLTAAFCAFMSFVGRRLLSRVADAYDEAGHVPAGWVAAIFVGVLLSAYLAASIPIAAIFGAFVMGLAMPRRADLTHDVSRRIEDFVTVVLLPLFFVVTGLRTEIGLLDRPVLWGIAAAVLGLAVVAKFVGASLAARYAGMGGRESAVLGVLMNTRGLTELIVLNVAIGLTPPVITPALFTILVLMALATTFMAGPLLRLFDPHRTLSASPEEQLHAAVPEPRRAILVSPLDERNAEALVALAAPLATTGPARQVICARLLTPSRTVTGLAAEDRRLAEATAELERYRRDLVARGIIARAVAFTSPNPGEDLVRLAGEQHVDLVLVDGRRPLLGEGIPRGDVGTVLERAECDVAVLVEREGRPPAPGPDRPVAVPFGGAEHDWAALELGAWLATATRSPLRLLGARAEEGDGERDASRLLANASLVVQQLAGIVAQPVLVTPGRAGVVEAAAGAGILVVGLSERWRSEGLGVVRSEIARHAPAPVLFVRRGIRPGALAPRDDVTRFTWSAAG